MLLDRTPRPMLDAFLRQVKQPTEVSLKWMDWPLALLACIPFLLAPLHGYGLILGPLATCATLFYRKSQRDRQLSAATPEVRAAYERWLRSSRLVYLCKNNRLNAHVPAPVLNSLEAAARAWHHASEELRLLVSADPVLVAEMQAEVDALMMSAASAAHPVIRRDDQSRKHMKAMEADVDLMSRICRRIDIEGRKLERWAEDTQALSSSSGKSLRENLAKAQSERAAAEAELEEVLRVES